MVGPSENCLCRRLARDAQCRGPGHHFWRLIWRYHHRMRQRMLSLYVLEVSLKLLSLIRRSVCGNWHGQAQIPDRKREGHLWKFLLLHESCGSFLCGDQMSKVLQKSSGWRCSSKFWLRTSLLQVDPYLEDALCSTCLLKQGPYFCRCHTLLPTVSQEPLYSHQSAL